MLPGSVFNSRLPLFVLEHVGRTWGKKQSCVDSTYLYIHVYIYIHIIHRPSPRTMTRQVVCQDMSRYVKICQDGGCWWTSPPSSFRGEAQVQDVRGAKIDMPTGNPNSEDYADEIAKNCFVWCGFMWDVCCKLCFTNSSASHFRCFFELFSKKGS